MVESDDRCPITGLEIKAHLKVIRRLQGEALNASALYNLDLPGVLRYEPSTFVWTTREGFRAVIFRNKTIGTYCGYLELGDDFTLYTSYDDFPVQVHGGLTYMGRLEFATDFPDLKPFELSIGFDTAHSGDLLPFLKDLMQSRFQFFYRSFDYVFEELKSLSNQIQTLRLQ